jgi:hypothetical protein
MYFEMRQSLLLGFIADKYGRTIPSCIYNITVIIVFLRLLVIMVYPTPFFVFVLFFKDISYFDAIMGKFSYKIYAYC